MIIAKLLNFRLLKDNIVKIDENNIAYYKKFDKIVFEIAKEKYYFKCDDKSLEFQKDNDESIFNINIGKSKRSSICLKENNLLFPIKIIYSNIITNNNKYIIEYLLESDDTKTKIEIELL